MDVLKLLSGLPHKSHVYGSTSWLEDPNHYPVYAQVYRALAPRSIYEIGAFIGYSLATAAAVLPGLEWLEWADDESAVAGSNRLALENMLYGAERADRSGSDILLRYSWHSSNPLLRILSDRRIDLVHIDADHRFGPCLADLKFAESLAPKFIIGHDVGLAGSGVRRAVQRHLLATAGEGYLEVPLTNGLFIIPRQEGLEVCLDRLLREGVRGTIVHRIEGQQ